MIRFAISNLTWPLEADGEAMQAARGLGYAGIEIAPVKQFGPLAVASDADIRAYRARLEGEGLCCPALQGLLFGVRGASLFGPTAERTALAAALTRVAEVAALLGAGSCVFGSPALRDPGNLPEEAALDQATRFFQAVGRIFADHGTTLCIEANAPFYGCRFIQRTDEAADLVARIDSPGIRLQLDTGTLFLMREDPAVLRRVLPWIGHAHVSEPGLAVLGAGGCDHGPLGAVFRGLGYAGWVSAEMKRCADWRDAMARALDLMRREYQ